jgi:DNA repair protein RadD
MILRNYQVDLILKLRNRLASKVRRLCVVLATGGGKTAIFCWIAGQISQRNQRTWIFVHRTEIANQTSETLTAWNVGHGRISPGVKYDGQPVQVVSIDTFAGQLENGIAPTDKPDVVVIDECDLSESKTWQRVIVAFTGSILLGFTGSPQRLDGKGLGNSYDELVMGPSVSFLMEAGYLARPIYYGVKTSPDLSEANKEGGDYSKAALQAVVDGSSMLTGDVLQTYLDNADGTRFLGFCTSIKHAEKLADIFNRAGIPCAAVNAKSKDRLQRINELKIGRIMGIFQVDLFGRGTDLPCVETGLDCRPTMSLARFIQAVGRILRPYEGKIKRWFDFAGNIQRHGLAETEREFTLKGIHKKTRTQEMLEAIRQCQTCWGWFAPAPICPQCGAILPVKQRATKEQDGHLQLLTPEDVAKAQEAAKQAVLERKACKTFGELVAYGKRTGKKPGWAHHVWRGRR